MCSFEIYSKRLVQASIHTHVSNVIPLVLLKLAPTMSRHSLGLLTPYTCSTTSSAPTSKLRLSDHAITTLKCIFVKTYRIAGNFRMVQIFAIFADRPASAKIKTAKKLMTSLRAYVEYPCERDGSLQSVNPLNGCCKEESAFYCTKYQRNHKRRSEDVASTGRGVVRVSRVPRK